MLLVALENLFYNYKFIPVTNIKITETSVNKVLKKCCHFIFFTYIIMKPENINILNTWKPK